MKEDIKFTEKVYVMGVLNVTPDSFFDGGKYLSLQNAIRHAHQLVEQGADIIDIGGESTRPGAKPISIDQELNRVLPVIERLNAETNIPLSIDTYKPEVAKRSLDLGVSVINDVTGLRKSEMVELVAEYNVPTVIVHMPGTPQTMQKYATYQNVVCEVKKFFEDRIQSVTSLGVEKIIIDPGFGFGKTPDHNYKLLRDMSCLKELGFPIMIGPSRKKFKGINQEGALEVLVIGLLHGAGIIRVHDAELGCRARERYYDIKS